MTKRKKSRVTMKKHGGDDAYSWAVFIDGRVKWNGMTRSEATWRRDTERRNLGEIQ